MIQIKKKRARLLLFITQLFKKVVIQKQKKKICFHWKIFTFRFNIS